MSGDSFWETKYLNSEKSIEFLKQTHAEILKGLHDEIETLQKQCSEYALKLSLQAPTAIEREEFEKKYRSYNSEYKKKDSLIAEQRKLIEERNRNVKSLEERVKTLERRQEAELANKDQTIDKLRQQIENQSLQIANLTFQMHHLNKNVLAKLNQNGGSANEAAASNLKPLSPKLLKSSSNSHRPSLIQTSSSSSSLHVAKEKPSQGDPSIYYSQPKLNLTSGNSNRVKINIENIEASAVEPSPPASANRSNASSARSSIDRASIPVVTKVLPPVIMSHNHHRQHMATNTHHRSSAAAVILDSSGAAVASSFLNSTQSTLHSRVKKMSGERAGEQRTTNIDLIQQRRTLITLPPITQKSTELNQFVVESPLKINSASASHNHQNNAATQ